MSARTLRCTHCTVDGAQRHEALHVVGQRTAVSVPVGIFSSLQDELLALEVMVLETHPASRRRRETELCFGHITSTRILVNQET